MRRTGIVVALGMLCALSATVPSVQAATPADGVLDFTVLREGEPIGHHRLSFTNKGDSMQIDIETDIAVKVLFVTAYRFEHDGHEIWRDGKLMRLWSKTNDDGTAHNLSVSADASGLNVNGDAATYTAPQMIPASLWNAGILQGGAVLNTLDGRSMNITVSDLGHGTVVVKGQRRMAHHYRISGDLDRDLWYDENDVLVRVVFQGKDHSRIEYVLK